MAKRTIVIVGDGVIGRSAAWALARAGERVIVIGDGVPGASAAAGGMLAPSFEALHPRLDTRGVPALHDALRLWTTFSATLEADADCPFDYQRNGIVGLGFPKGTLVEADACAVPAGFIADHAACVPGEGQVDPRLFLRALAQGAAKRGVETLNAAVVELAQSNGQVIGVRTEDGQVVQADAVVVATGGRSAERLLPTMAGAIVPVRGRAFFVESRSQTPETVVRTPDIYFCPKSGTELYIGATEEALLGDDASLNDLWAAAIDIFPAVASMPVLTTFDGVRPASASGMPIVGPVEGVEGAFTAIGHDRNGVLLSPLTTKRLFEHLLPRAGLHDAPWLASRTVARNG